MPVERVACGTAEAAATAERLRSLVPAAESVSGAVAEIVATVRRGDAGLLEVERRFGGGDLPVRVSEEELRAALDGLDRAVREGLETAVANVRRVAEAGLADDTAVVFSEGHPGPPRGPPRGPPPRDPPGGRAPHPA